MIVGPVRDGDGLAIGRRLHDQARPMTDSPRLLDDRVEEGLESILEKVYEGGGEDDTRPKVLSDEEEDAWHADRAVCRSEGGERDGYGREVDAGVNRTYWKEGSPNRETMKIASMTSSRSVSLSSSAEAMVA